MTIEIYEGDITKLDVDAIVNAANKLLLGGGGVDGAIHMAAGPKLLLECRTLKGCETGKAKITKGYELPARYVIHTVGPIWNGGNTGEEDLLASCYNECLALAEENDVRTIAFPAISTGAYRFPIQRATEIAVNTVKKHLAGETTVEKVLFCCFGARFTKAYELELAKYN